MIFSDDFTVEADLLVSGTSRIMPFSFGVDCMSSS